MEARREKIFLALFYPFTTAAIAAGFLAFMMIMLKLDTIVILTAVLGFYFACTASIYFISARALKAFGLRRFFLSFTITIGIFAMLSAVILIWERLSYS